MRRSETASIHKGQSEVLLLEISCDADQLYLSLSTRGGGDMHTIRQVEELRVPMHRIDRRCRLMVETLNAANRQGRLTDGLLGKLKQTGQLFRDELFSTRIKDKLNAAPARHLILSLDDRLIHIPWELLHDGDVFFSQKFAMGRVVRTRRPVAANQVRSLGRPLRLLIVADPAADLEAAYDEGIYLRDFVEPMKDRLQVTYRSGEMSTDFLRTKLRDYDLVHFAGHADYDTARPELSGWRLGKERLTGADVMKMAATGAMPSLVFANACQSARSQIPGVGGDFQERIFGLANAFILAGVKHYLGTFWEISDVFSRHFAAAVYQQLLSGTTIGRALQAARQTLVSRYGEDNIIWASYLLYGDPTTVYLTDVPAGEPAAEPGDPRNAASEPAATGLRTPEEVFQFTSRRSAKHVRAAARRAFFLGILLVLAVAFGWVWKDGLSKSLHDSEQQMLAAFDAGDYGRVVEVCRQLQEQQPQRILSYLMLGKVYFTQGKLESAHRFYQQAVSGRRGSAVEKAEALIGLGRIASVNGEMDQALDFYRQAAQLAPSSERPYLSQAVLLERQGKLEQADQLLQKARGLSRDPHPIEAFSAQIRSRTSLVSDQQRLERIDRLIEELSNRSQEVRPESLAAESGGQLQSGLTVWMMDLEAVGYHLQEGQSLMLTSACLALLMEEPRINVVERALLDKVMAELKLGSSQLVDQPSYLSLGRLVAARLIIFGRLVYEGALTQANLRCVDVETGEIKAVVSVPFNTATPTSEMASRLVGELKDKLFVSGGR